MAMATTPQVSLSNLSKAYKELFPQIRLNQLAEMDRDLFKWLPKKDDLVGGDTAAGGAGYYFVPVRYGMPQSILSSFTGAQTLSGDQYAGRGRVTRFELQRNSYYGVLALDDESIRAARDRNGAFYDVKETEIEDLVKSISMELEKHLWRDGDGKLGTVSGTPAANVITLTNADDVANFHVGMYITDEASSQGTYVTGLSLNDGTITVADDTGFADTEKIYRSDSTAGSAADDDGAVVIGVAGWIPETASSATFKGCTVRGEDEERLQGFRQSYLGSIEETLKKCASKMRRYGANYDTIWLSHNNWHRLEQELGARAIRQDASATPFGMPSLKYASPDGVKTVMAGAFCPDSTGYLMKRDSWTLHHMDPVPHIVTTDGLRTARLSSADGIEIRVRMWVDLGCKEPKNNGVISIT